MLRYQGTLGILDAREGHVFLVFFFHFMKDNTWCEINTKLDKFVYVWHQWLRKIEHSHRVQLSIGNLTLSNRDLIQA